ncbi:MAG: FHA domain-containing protein [Deltaproteobacteria bacterium]|nr:FHA domain-containing protein [Deltaproteobacteria bacterium]
MKRVQRPANIDDTRTHPIPGRRDRISRKGPRKRRVGKLVIIAGKNAGKEYQCYSQTTLIGRTRENHIAIRDTATSRRHARIERRDDDFIVEDLNSTNGTLLNGNAITREILHHGDKIQIGETVLQFILEEKV